MEATTNSFTGSGNLATNFRSQAVQALAAFREEWQQHAEGESLLTVKAPVGLILTDIADMLELSSQERHKALGDALIQEVNYFVQEQFQLSN